MNLSAALKDEDPTDGKEKIVDATILPDGPALSLVSVKPKFTDYVEAAEKMVIDAKKIDVKDDESLNIAVMMGGNAKKITKSIEAKKKEVTAEASDFVKSVNGFCKIFTDKLSDIEMTLKKKISAYQAKIELERRKQEDLAKKAAEDLQKKINAEAEKAGVEAPTVPAPVIPKQETVVRTETGTSSYQVKSWKCRIVDASIVPRQYCEPSTKLLNDAIKLGVREIPGCVIEEISDTRFRT